MKTIAIGSDHRGFMQKSLIINKFINIAWIDVGCDSELRCDYPIFAHAVVKKINAGDAQEGILLCGSGIGMSIAANRFKGIFAGLAWRPEVARAGKEDDAINILVLPSDFISDENVLLCIQAWLSANPKGGRYAQRRAMLDRD